MRITNVVLQHWRGIEQLELSDLDPGLNLILGDNETGKSRVAQAIWFGLFESSKGKSKHKTDLLSWDGNGDPRVELALECDGLSYRIVKVFGKPTHNTVLEGSGETWHGEEAERVLASLLQVDPEEISRHAKDEALGMWPLLWVRQFESGTEPDRALNANARSRLQDILADSVGEVAAGQAGHALLEKAREQRAIFYTDGGQKRKRLTDAEAAVEGARTELRKAREAREQVVGASDELATLRLDLKRQEESVAKSRVALEEARKRASEAGDLRARIEVVRGDAKGLEGQVSSLRRDLETRQEREESLGTARSERERICRKEIEPLQDEQREASAQLEKAKTDLLAAAETRKSAKDRARRAADQMKRKELDRRIAEEEKKVKQARDMQERIRQVAKKHGEIRAEKKAVEDLKEAHREWEKTRARLLGASTHVRLQARRELSIDGEPLAEGAARDWTCTKPTTIRIDDTADFEITPGGKELSALQEDVTRLKGEWEALLRDIGAETVEAAEAALQEKSKLSQQQKDLEKLFKDTYPEGVSALEVVLAGFVGQRQTLGPGDPEAPDELEADAGVTAAENEENEKRGAVEAIQKVLSGIDNRLTAARANVDGYERTAKELGGLLERTPSKEELEKQLRVVESKWQTALATVKGMEEQYKEKGGQQTENDVERLQKAYEGLKVELDQMVERRAELKTELGILAGQDIYEKEQDAATRLGEAERAEKDLKRRAAAAKKLSDTLEACRTARQKRLLAPAVAAVRRHLHVLFPGIDIALDENLGVAGLQTANRAEPLVDLSGGTREQVGMIVRVGLAELLAGDERLPLVFDDALTNTDFRRIARMHQVLFEAAKKLQILVFSCHPEAFEGLGAGRRYRLREPPKRKVIVESH
jgi:DNA repair exonuclease SbcCD ATPase subunit